MRFEIFCIHDEKAGAFLAPFFLPNEAMALRTFRDCANDPQHMFCRHPRDYALYRIGSYEDSSGLIAAYPKPQYLSLAFMMQPGQEDVSEIVPAALKAAS